MHLSWGTEDTQGLGSLRAIPGYYDGTPPVDSLILGTSPERQESNLVAAAGALAFEAYVTDELSLETPVLPLVADAIMTFFSPLRVRCGYVQHHPRRMAEGQGTFTVTPLGEADSSGTDSPTLGHFDIHLVNSYEAPRGFAHKQSIYLPSNASLISPRHENDARRFFPELAALLMLTGEFGVRNIRIAQHPWSNDEAHLVRARDLLRAVNRELIWS